MSENTFNPPFNLELDYFLVCGLGSLGQHCVNALAEFQVKVIGVEQEVPLSWEIDYVPDLLENLIIGDSRQNKILKQAKIKQCRAALIVTGSEQVNIEIALAIGQLNDETRLVVRSGKKNLNQLLSQQLGNFIAFEPTEITISAFVLAVLGTDMLGFFNLNGRMLQVYQRRIKKGDSWCYRRLSDLESYQTKILAHIHDHTDFSQSFAHWNPDDQVKINDIVIYLKIAAEFDTGLHLASYASRKRNHHNLLESVFQRLRPRKAIGLFLELNFQQQVRRLALLCAIIVLIFLITGTILLHWHYPNFSLLTAFLATSVLLLGGFGDLFGEFEFLAPIPWWMQLFSLGLTLVGTAFVGVL